MDMITRSNVFMIDPVIQLMKDVNREEENRKILQTDLRSMDILLDHITTVLQDQPPEVARETLKVWLQLLHNCLTEAKSILHRSDPSQRCLDCLRCNPGRLSKQIKKWRVLFNYLFEALQRDFSIFISGREAVIAPVIPLIKDVIQEEEILQTELRPVENLLLDISAVFQDQQKAGPEALKIWLRQLHNSLTEANSILHRSGGPSQRQRRLDCLMGYPGRTPKELKEWKVHINYLFQGLQRDFSIFVAAIQIIHKNPMQLKSAQESIVGQDEAWMLFKRIAFKDSPVSLDIEEYARNIADECKGLPLAITLVAAAMMGKTTVDEWRTCFSSIKNADPSSPDTELHSCFDPKPLYQRLIRWSYDALPNSNVKNCYV